MITRQLPRGRHQLTREEVAADQRRRMLDALAAAMGEKGYLATTVTDVIKRAGVSRETFYEQFEDKRACFLAAFDERRARVVTAMTTEPTTGTPIERFEQMLGRYLAVLAASPDDARLFLVEIHAAGPDVLHRRLESQRDFVAGVATVLKVRSKRDRFACEALVAAISTMTTNALLDGGNSAIEALHRPLVDLARRLFA